MKDSRLGTFGALALWFSLTAKFLLLYTLLERSVWLAFAAMVTAHALGRAACVALLYFYPYVRVGESKSKPFGNSVTRRQLWPALAFPALLAFALMGQVAAACILAAVLVTGLAGVYFKRKIGGVTGAPPPLMFTAVLPTTNCCPAGRCQSERQSLGNRFAARWSSEPAGYPIALGAGTASGSCTLRQHRGGETTPEQPTPRRCRALPGRLHWQVQQTQEGKFLKGQIDDGTGLGDAHLPMQDLSDCVRAGRSVAQPPHGRDGRIEGVYRSAPSRRPTLRCPATRCVSWPTVSDRLLRSVS